MNYIDIAELLRSALIESGCSQSQIGTFDGNSTIEVECVNSPSLFINENEGQVWVWSRLNEENNYMLMQKSAGLLTLMMSPFVWAVNDQLQLVNDQGYLVMKCNVKPDYLENGLRFSEVLQQFFESQNAFLSALR